MAYLQFMNGSRADQLQELSRSSLLIVGNSSEAHVQLTDEGIGATHCSIYPAEGSYWLQAKGQGLTLINTRRLNNGETGKLQPNDVLILGKTFVRFLAEKPASLGADPAALERTQQRIAELEAELEATKAEHKATKAAKAEQRSRFEAQATEAQGLSNKLERLRSEVNQGGKESEERVRALAEREEDLEKLGAELDAAKLRARQRDEELESLGAELAEATKDQERLRLESHQSHDTLAALKSAVDEKADQLEQGSKERETAHNHAQRLGEELKLVSTQAAEDSLAREESEERLAEVEAEREDLISEVEASRVALEALGVSGPTPDLLTRKGTSLAEALDGLDLPAELRRGLERAVRAEIEGESLRRFAGPPLPWTRTDEAVETQLWKLRERGEQVDLALRLGIPGTGTPHT
ncbi:MAG: FHA domain-containing protein [Planctomycetes bacterium]|nr:FHA domain-containing protein [Planctomycetota bacterium]